jgi:ectoine hydroxylase-related dioxygenase (phytanoyl-CoA dioxygenase family)
MYISENDQKTYNDHGFVVIKNLVDCQKHDLLLRGLVKVLRKYDKKCTLKIDCINSWDDDILTDSLIDFRKRQPSLFGAFYDTMQTNTILQSLLIQDNIINVIADLFNQESDTLASTGYMLRMDTPKDERNTYDWHQDSAYYKQNTVGSHGCVVVIPLVDINPRNGSLSILSGSQNEKVLEHKLYKSESIDIASQKFTVPKNIVDKYPEVDLCANKGDVVFMQMNLIHKSGFNISNRVRFTTGIRFHKTLVSDFLPGRIVYKPTNLSK